MTFGEIVGLFVFCVLLVIFFVSLFLGLCNEYEVFCYDGRCFVIRNSFRTYRILSVEKTGVFVSVKSGQRFINASNIKNFGLLRFRVFERNL